MKPQPRVYLNELQHAAMLAGLNYEVWWVIVGSETRKKYLRILNKYSHFFVASEQAHITSLVVTLCKLFETRKDTYNIPGYLKLMEEDCAYTPETIARFRAIVKELSSLLKKVRILRNKNYAHRIIGLTVKEIFEEASVTPNELRDLVAKTKHLINFMSNELDRSSHSILGAHSDTISILEMLNKKINEPHSAS